MQHDNAVHSMSEESHVAQAETARKQVRSKKQSPTTPWRPSTLSKKSISEERTDKGKRVWDLRFKVDGHEYRIRFPTKTAAGERWKSILVGHDNGWLWDPLARRFREEDAPTAADAVTVSVYVAARSYFENQAGRLKKWSPATTNQHAQHLYRLIMFLMPESKRVAGGPKRGQKDSGWSRAQAFLLKHVLVPEPTPIENLDEGSRRWHEFFDGHSRQLGIVDTASIEDFFISLRTCLDYDGSETERGDRGMLNFWQKTSQFFAWVAEKKLVETNPFDGVDGAFRPDLSTSYKEVDVDRLLSIEQFLEVAEAFALGAPEWPWALDAAYLSRFGALRPQELVSLTTYSVVFPEDSRTGRLELILSSGYSRAPKRLLPKDDRSVPLKHRRQGDTRTVPLPSFLEPRLRKLVEPLRQGSYLFPSAKKSKITQANPARISTKWRQAAKATLSADAFKTMSVTFDDNRHAGITDWLSARVPLTTAKRWAGHKKLDVMLNVYAGAFGDDEALGCGRMEEYLSLALPSAIWHSSEIPPDFDDAQGRRYRFLRGVGLTVGEAVAAIKATHASSTIEAVAS
jgi:integrase